MAKNVAKRHTVSYVTFIIGLLLIVIGFSSAAGTTCSTPMVTVGQSTYRCPISVTSLLSFGAGIVLLILGLTFYVSKTSIYNRRMNKKVLKP
jgi:hypothetical protein